MCSVFAMALILTLAVHRLSSSPVDLHHTSQMYSPISREVHPMIPGVIVSCQPLLARTSVTEKHVFSSDKLIPTPQSNCKDGRLCMTTCLYSLVSSLPFEFNIEFDHQSINAPLANNCHALALRVLTCLASKNATYTATHRGQPPSYSNSTRAVIRTCPSISSEHSGSGIRLLVSFLRSLWPLVRVPSSMKH